MIGKKRYREAIIRPLALGSVCPLSLAEKAAQKLNMTARYIYTLIKRYRSGHRTLSTLLHAKPTGGRGKGRLGAEIESLIQATIEELYLNKQKLLPSVIVEEARKRCRYMNLRTPARNTICQRIQQISAYKIASCRQGKSAAHPLTAIQSVTPMPDAPLRMLQINHTLVDVIIVDEQYRKPIGRPYLTLAIDIYSRCVTGFCLTLESPSAV